MHACNTSQIGCQLAEHAEVQFYMAQHTTSHLWQLPQEMAPVHLQYARRPLSCVHRFAPGPVHCGESLPLQWQLLHDVIAAEDGFQVHPRALQGDPLLKHLTDLQGTSTSAVTTDYLGQDQKQDQI